MRMTVKQLKQVIREMKLGVASSYAPGEAWGVKDDEPDPYEAGKEGSEFIATEDPLNFEPPEAIKALYRSRGGHDMAGDPMEHPPHPEPPQQSGMRATIPHKKKAMGQGK